MKPALLTVSSTSQERGAEKIHDKYVNSLKGFYSEIFPILMSIKAIRGIGGKIGEYPLIMLL